MHNVQNGVFGFMTPTVKTVRMSPAISALAAVNSRFPQSAERTINELWAHRRGRAAQPQSRASAVAKGVAVTVERTRRRDGAADHQSSRVLMRSAPTQYCRISSKGRASALSRATARVGFEKPHAQGGRLFWTRHVFCRCQLLDMHFRRLRTDLAVSPAVMLASAHHLASFRRRLCARKIYTT